jgi:hypothetical protein
VVGRIFYDAAKLPSRAPNPGEADIWAWLFIAFLVVGGIVGGSIWIWEHAILPVLPLLVVGGIVLPLGLGIGWLVLRPLRRWTR